MSSKKSTCHVHGGLLTPVFQLLAVLGCFPRSVQSAECRELWCTIQCHSQWLQECCFDKNPSWSTKQTIMTSLGLFFLCCCWECFVVPTLLLNWIHSKIIGAAAFHIIGLAKIQRIEFLLLNWIYCSIRIMTVFKKNNNEHNWFLVVKHNISWYAHSVVGHK